jgi:hypothetical protein
MFSIPLYFDYNVDEIDVFRHKKMKGFGTSLKEPPKPYCFGKQSGPYWMHKTFDTE